MEQKRLKMAELLKVIVLACQVSTGANHNFLKESYEIQRKCQKEMVKCMKNKVKSRLWYAGDLADCLLESK